MWVIIHNLQPVSVTRYEIKNTMWLFSTSLFFFFRFHNSWLRFSCQCGNCKQEHSGQRIFKISSLPDPIKIPYFSVSGKLFEQPEVNLCSIYKGNIYQINLSTEKCINNDNYFNCWNWSVILKAFERNGRFLIKADASSTQDRAFWAVFSSGGCCGVPWFLTEASAVS